MLPVLAVINVPLTHIEIYTHTLTHTHTNLGTRCAGTFSSCFFFLDQRRKATVGLENPNKRPHTKKQLALEAPSRDALFYFSKYTCSITLELSTRTDRYTQRMRLLNYDGLTEEGNNRRRESIRSETSEKKTSDSRHHPAEQFPMDRNTCEGSSQGTKPV